MEKVEIVSIPKRDLNSLLGIINSKYFCFEKSDQFVLSAFKGSRLFHLNDFLDVIRNYPELFETLDENKKGYIKVLLKDSDVGVFIVKLFSMVLSYLLTKIHVLGKIISSELISMDDEVITFSVNYYLNKEYDDVLQWK